MACVLPEGPLYGHYANKGQLYTVHSGSPDIVLHTPSPEEAPVPDSSTIIPLFRQPLYLSLKYAYLLFVPRHYAWRNELFRALDCPRHRLPIVKDQKEGFCLHPDVAEEWMDLEICLRAMGSAMLGLAPQRHLSKLISSWFFPARFKFMHSFRTEGAARFAAWRSIENFLPLLGYVSMGLWCMKCWEDSERDRGAAVPDWRLQVTTQTNIHPTFLDYLEQSVVGDWNEARVGALYRIRPPAEIDYTEREAREDMERLLATILYSKFPIPIYLSWGELPKQISFFNVPGSFQALVPNTDELEYLALPRWRMKFSRWAVDDVALLWYRVPYTPASMPDSDPVSPTNESPAAAAAPFPPLPPHSQQKQNETIQAFFIRRRAANMKTIAKETRVDRDRRIQRAKNAERGGVPSKATVFVWEEQDGHYIRRAGGRGNYADLWSEYPGPQRRFDPIFNQWDLCELFEKGDPVFGEGYPEEPPSDDDDDDFGMHPTFPQNVDMASRLPREGNNMQVSEEQPPHDLEMASIEDVPADGDLGPDLTESQVPYRNVAEASRKYVNLVYLKFGLAPRLHEPEYESVSVAGSLLDALQKQFGFVMPPSPDMFVARDPPEKSPGLLDIHNVVGMGDIGNQLASQKGLQRVLGIFFGQCVVARSIGGIDKMLMQQSVPPHSPFEIRREYLKSRRHPSSEYSLHYVLRRVGSGIGSEVLLLPRATDLLEILRQQWGPEIRDVVGHLVARGIPFWLAYISAEIMPESELVVSGPRPRHSKVDNSSGLGFRPRDYNFDHHDYNAYCTQRDLQLLHTPRGRIALQYGGIIARLARSEVSDEDFFCGFDDAIYNVGDCLWDGTSQHAYWHDRLSDHEIDLLCGVYHVATGQMAKRGPGKNEEDWIETDQSLTVSWWPKRNAWARGGLDGAWWTSQCEDDFFQKRLGHLKNGVYVLKNQTGWKHNLKYRKEVKRCWDGYENVAQSIVQSLLPSVVQSSS